MDYKLKIQKFIELRAEEISLDKISKSIDVSKPTLVKWCKDYKLEIHNHKSVLIDMLKDEFLLSRREELEFLKTLISSLNNELLRRDLSEIPTDKLYKLRQEVKNEIRDSL